jgi:hypothetical protein
LKTAFISEEFSQETNLSPWPLLIQIPISFKTKYINSFSQAIQENQTAFKTESPARQEEHYVTLEIRANVSRT